MKPVYVYVTPFFPSEGRHYGSYSYDFVAALTRYGNYDVRVFVAESGEDYVFQGIHVHRFAIKNLPSAAFPLMFKRHNQSSFLKAIKNAGISTDQIAVCHANTATYAIYPLAVKARNGKCLTLLHHHDPQSFGIGLGVLRHLWVYRMIQFPLMRHLHEQIDIHVFISEFVKRNFLNAPMTPGVVYSDYKKQMSGLPYRPTRIKRSVVLHNGVNPIIFNRSTVHQAGHQFVIGCIANYVDWKEHITLLRAFKLLVERQLGNLLLELVGIGAMRPMCEEYVAKNHLEESVSFVDAVNHDKMADVYRRFDLFVLPSIFEGFGCVFTEAWACGVPFITCKGQGMDDLVPESERDTWLSEPSNPEDLANKIGYYIQHRPVQNLCGEITFDKLMPQFLKEIQS